MSKSGPPGSDANVEFTSRRTSRRRRSRPLMARRRGHDLVRGRAVRTKLAHAFRRTRWSPTILRTVAWERRDPRGAAGGPRVVPFGGAGPCREETGLAARFVPGTIVGGFDPAAGYRPFEEQVERLDARAAPSRWRRARPARVAEPLEVAVRAPATGRRVELPAPIDASEASTRARTSAGSPIGCDTVSSFAR